MIRTAARLEGVTTVQSREALAYAFTREMLVLYGVVVTGYAASLSAGWFWTNWAVRGGGAGVVGQALAVVLLLAGAVAALGGLVGLVYKVIADANAAARS